VTSSVIVFAGIVKRVSGDAAQQTELFELGVQKSLVLLLSAEEVSILQSVLTALVSLATRSVTFPASSRYI
jgi:hypothetical protein